MSARRFSLDEVLTIGTGRLVAYRHMDAVYDVLNFMTGDNLFTHQLPRAMDSCRPALVEQHPWLADVAIPDFDGDHDAVKAWVADQVAAYGESALIVPLAEWEHRDAVEEACDLAGAEKVYVVPAEASA